MGRCSQQRENLRVDGQSMFALIDGNNFYTSAEQAFRCALKGQPVIVASNNDGCTISRSEEAKALGVKMGQPLFQLKPLIAHKGLVCLSANFELYGDLSDRMMSLAAGLGPIQEVYSIDESFIGGLDGIRNLTQRAWAVRARIEQWVGIPCCVGLGPTKTISKLCNKVAKDAERKPGSYPAEFVRVCNWQEMDARMQEDILRRTPAGDIWGVGKRISLQLAERGILTALDLAHMPTSIARTQWSVVLERTVRELQGVSCIPIEQAPPPKKQIACTRSFGHPISTLDPLIEAVSEFASRAGEKLRSQGLCAGAILVFAHTSPFRPGPRFSKSATVTLQPATSDTRILVGAAVRGLRSIFQPGYQLSKAGVMLLDLVSGHSLQNDMLAEFLPYHDQSPLMEAVDHLNRRYGKGTLRVGSSGFEHVDPDGWRMKQERRTPRYTTRLNEVPIVRA